MKSPTNRVLQSKKNELGKNHGDLQEIDDIW